MYAAAGCAHASPCISKPSRIGTRPRPFSCARATARTAKFVSDPCATCPTGLPHGHAAAALGAARKIGLDRILGPGGNRYRDLYRIPTARASSLIDRCKSTAIIDEETDRGRTILFNSNTFRDGQYAKKTLLILEELVRAYFARQGFFALRGVSYRFEDEEVTDIDAWLYGRQSASVRVSAIVTLNPKRVTAGGGAKRS